MYAVVLSLGRGGPSVAPTRAALIQKKDLFGTFCILSNSSGEEEEESARRGRVISRVLVVILIALNVYNLFGPPPAAFMEVFGLAMVSYLGLAGIAFRLDRLRPPRPEPTT